MTAHFQNAVMGQNEAVDCLVKQIAMVKAGLTDPSKPLGVFLFAGPTGTGKTELAKALAGYLFSSEDRMLRLDMSELKTAESTSRIVGEPGVDHDRQVLVHRIRKQPFSVVLLDEFEKAHPNIWDLFLQVFDDGRLTDAKGNTANFRHSIIIMTSNLGATIPRGTSIGFGADAKHFTASRVERAVVQAFRREFVNRIDRIVVFRPLGRHIMRRILQKELAAVLDRRGLRNREWAIEWDEGAIDFLLNRGFTPDMGARPLKRAVEQYLLAPLAMTIVKHQFPEGEQFLFVKSTGDQLAVVFVDPEVDSDIDRGSEAIVVPEETPQIRQLALAAKGTHKEFLALKTHFDALSEKTTRAEWQKRKEDGYARMARPDFWEDPNRFSYLGDTELMDRMEAALQSAVRILNRLERAASKPDGRIARTPLRDLAHQLYLVNAALSAFEGGQSQDGFIFVEANLAGTKSRKRHIEFAQSLSEMYVSWANRLAFFCGIRRARDESFQQEIKKRTTTNASVQIPFFSFRRSHGLRNFFFRPGGGRKHSA